MNIDMMEAGRELDTLVAEKVLGWRLLNSETYEPVISDSERKDASNNDGWHWEGRGGHSEAWEWRPSSKIHDAWEVLEKMSEILDGQAISVCWGNYGDEGMGASVLTFYDHSAVANTVPLAICRAALKVVNAG